MDFYNSFPPPFAPFVLFLCLSMVFSLFFLEIISKPHTFRYFHRHRTFAMVIRGIAVKNYPDPIGEGGGVWSVGKRVVYAGINGGGRREKQQPSITSLFTDFSAGRHVDICNYRTEATTAVFIRDPNDDF